MEIITKSQRETFKLGQNVGGNLARFSNKDKAFVVGLNGELGSGKTTFVQGISKGLNINGLIPSPTFIIVRQYLIDTFSFKNLYHIDLYRLIENKAEIANLGLTEFFNESSNIVIIEWANQFGNYFPPINNFLNFSIIDDLTRKITVSGPIEKIINS